MIMKLKKILLNLVDMSPRGIREHLKLNKPIYVPTSAYGHFGRTPDEVLEGSFSWEKTDLVDLILKGNLNNLKINSFIDCPIFFGRRKGRRLSKSSELAIKEGKKYLIQKKDLTKMFESNNNIILEIGFGDGDNLINSARLNSNFLYIGADPFINTTAKCLNKLLLHNIQNVAIWPDDIRKIISYFPYNSISEIKLLFPDPWPKKKHQKRRLIQDEFIDVSIITKRNYNNSN